MKIRSFFLGLIAVLPFHAALAEPPPVSKVTPFVRAAERPDKTTVCETRLAEFRPASGRGPSVWLVGVAHIGTPEYYQAIQQRLDGYSVVLYEGIGLDEAKKSGPAAPGQQRGLQSNLAQALGLVFQLEAIDYRRAHFFNSDLKQDKIAGQVEARTKRDPQAGSDDLFASLMDALEGTGALGGMMKQVIAVLGQTPATREMTKAVLVEALGRADELIGLARTASPAMQDLFDVLLTERNAVVLADLRRQLTQRAAGDSIAIFYGAAHMEEIARQLRDELHYIPAREEWLAAFSADPEKGGINPVYVRFLIEMAKMQLKALQPQPPAK